MGAKDAARRFVLELGVKGICVVQSTRMGRPMALTFQPMDATSARAMLSWRYEPPYDVYNLEFDDVEAAIAFFLDPRNAYYAIRDDRGNLVAFCCFGHDAQVPGGDYRRAALDIGLGVRPDLTGQGQGLLFVNAVLDFALHTFGPAASRVTVAKFNERALRVWEKAGFRPVQEFKRELDGKPFVVLAPDVLSNEQHHSEASHE
jgi:ribosomal-protein-alanine N-acetyltransferase